MVGEVGAGDALVGGEASTSAGRQQHPCDDALAATETKRHTGGGWHVRVVPCPWLNLATV